VSILRRGGVVKAARFVRLRGLGTLVSEVNQLAGKPSFQNVFAEATPSRDRLIRPISWAAVVLEQAFLGRPLERNRRVIVRGVLDRLTR
jgi:hypothetical protein